MKSPFKAVALAICAAGWCGGLLFFNWRLRFWALGDGSVSPWEDPSLATMFGSWLVGMLMLTIAVGGRAAAINMLRIAAGAGFLVAGYGVVLNLLIVRGVVGEPFDASRWFIVTGTTPWWLLLVGSVGLFRLRWWGAVLTVGLGWLGVVALWGFNGLYLVMGDNSHATFLSPEFIALFEPMLAIALLLTQSVIVGRSRMLARL